MLVPLSWLQDYVDLTLPLTELVDRLTVAGLEVTGVRLIGLPKPEGLKAKLIDPGPVWARDRIVTAQVVSSVKHPDADRLKLVTLEFGAEQPKTVVTGADNIAVGDQGQKVVLALAGAVLLDGYSETRVMKELKPGKIRGILSEGMVCSAKELGIADEHEGIILMPAETPVGVPLVDLLGDAILEIDILPNMARCLGLVGVAREVAALTGQTLKLPPRQMQTAGSPIGAQVAVEIADPRLSGRYAVALVSDITVGPSSDWLKDRLSKARMRLINNIVDVTNYVMLEWGQPLHAFDFDKLCARAGGGPPTIRVRAAAAGEKLITLDGQERKLTEQHLVIADTAGPIALAGVMGGLETEVTADTRRVLIESANFDFVSVRRAARGLDLPSEASHRFSRGVHPELVLPALERAAELMRLHAGGTIAEGLVDCFPGPLVPPTVQLFPSEIERMLGIAIPLAEAQRILQTLDCTVEIVGESLRVTAPPHRLDIQHGVADLIEDVARIHGYDKLPATLLADRLPRQVNHDDLDREERIRDLLADLGLTEVINYALTTAAKEEPFGIPAADHLRLANPISSERDVLRRSVLASVLETAGRNLRSRPRVRLFELGLAYDPQSDAVLPDERRQLALVIAGPRQVEHLDIQETAPAVDFFDLKGVVEALLAGLHVPEIRFGPATVPYLHPGQTAEVMSGNQRLGLLGRVHPELQQVLELGRTAVFACELDVEALLRLIPSGHRLRPLSTFPPTLQDIALVVDETMPAERVEREIWAGGGDLLKDVRLFDVYRGPNLPAGKKSLAYALAYQADDRTLTDKEVAKAHGKIVSRLEKMLGATLRGGPA
ncbi:MAG TPA: phenylalanine--tRNA ligase subunit beta [Gemmatales bacterium]|nr:phenylalanine--tRNA ligase subunit beta [Gemmatales bacterium]